MSAQHPASPEKPGPTLWPRQAGTYVLVMRVPAPLQVRIGRLGASVLPAGWYVYVGSALGPGGLRGRLARHFRADKKLRWHIDYVLSSAAAATQAQPIAQVWYVCSAVRNECVWARELGALPGARVAMRGFGASDCHCPSHLLAFEAFPPFQLFAQRLSELGCVKIQRFVYLPG